ncbi:hypothetical protein Tco_1106759 [Tanacetum coccineum]
MVMDPARRRSSLIASLTEGKIETTQAVLSLLFTIMFKSKRHHIVPFGELNGIPVALVARFGVISKKRGDGVAGIKRRHRDLSSDGIRNLATTSGRGRLKEDLESSTW